MVTSKVWAVAAVPFDEPSSLGGPAKISRDNVVGRIQSEKKEKNERKGMKKRKNERMKDMDYGINSG